ncbi:MAG: hypothetical protein WCP06_03885 [Verrucomicrobiota bacterium]
MRLFLSLFAVVAAVIALPRVGCSSEPATPVSAPVVQDSVSGEFKKLMTALAERDYDAFVADGTPQVKAALTKQMFEGVGDQIGLRLKKGYDATFLTELKQQGCKIYVWKVVVHDGGDDFLAKLAMQGEKMAGFRIQ